MRSFELKTAKVFFCNLRGSFGLHVYIVQRHLYIVQEILYIVQDPQMADTKGLGLYIVLSFFLVLSCTQDGTVSSQSQKIVDSWKKELGVGRGYTSGLPAESLGLLNKRERDNLDVQYQFLMATQIVNFR